MNYKKNFGFNHKSGILMPISCLPSPYGIGGFGKQAYDFVDFLYETGQKCWQVLPLNPTSYGDSPYQSPASIAGNPYYIDLNILYKKKLLTKDELNDNKNTSTRVDYGWLFNTRYKVLKSAFKRFVPDKEFKQFCKKQKFWLDDYALFMTLKERYNHREWVTWNEEHRDSSIAKSNIHQYEDEMQFWKWIQYEFDLEWQKLRAYANDKGILIIGDIPIYVAHDSMDVWRAPKQFLLDENFNPTIVAGCPPDGFSPDGQLWGNPIYNWDLMKKDEFSWWCERVRATLKLYDIIRIDHFRGFAGFYSVPYGSPNARGGKWLSAPGSELFNTIKNKIPKAKIIAEDLGHITEDVRELLKETEFPGMKNLQFAFFDDDSEFLPRTYANPNCVVYSGTHDADCTKTWCDNIEGMAEVRFKKECPRHKGQSRTYDLIEFAHSSIANLSMIPMQDYLELTNDVARMNVPSIADGNWQWRISSRYATKSLKNKIYNMTKRNKRLSR